MLIGGCNLGVTVYNMLLSLVYGREGVINCDTIIMFDVELVVALLALMAAPLHGCCAHVATLHA